MKPKTQAILDYITVNPTFTFGEAVNAVKCKANTLRIYLLFWEREGHIKLISPKRPVNNRTYRLINALDRARKSNITSKAQVVWDYIRRNPNFRLGDIVMVTGYATHTVYKYLYFWELGGCIQLTSDKKPKNDRTYRLTKKSILAPKWRVREEIKK